MSIKDWPQMERPREKLLHHGALALSDAELLAIFLRTGIKGKSAIELARDLLKEFGSISSLVSASQVDFCRAKGLGEAKYVQFQAALEMTKRYTKEHTQRENAVANPEQVKSLLIQELKGIEREVFACLWLDSQHRVIDFEILFSGTLDQAAVYPREVVKAALRKNAAAVIFAHNHPSGIAEPSKSDEQITQELKKALSLVQVKTLDHFVIGSGPAVSLAQRGLL